MRYFEQVGVHIFLGYECFHLAFQIAGEESAGLSIGNQKGERVIVLRLQFRLVVGWRRNHPNACTRPEKLVTYEMFTYRHVVTVRDFFQLFESRRFRIDAKPQLSGRKVFYKAWQPANMITVRVRENHDIQMMNAAGPKIG